MAVLTGLAQALRGVLAAISRPLVEKLLGQPTQYQEGAEVADGGVECSLRFTCPLGKGHDRWNSTAGGARHHPGPRSNFCILFS